jgi:hypothetical protein
MLLAGIGEFEGEAVIGRDFCGVIGGREFTIGEDDRLMRCGDICCSLVALLADDALPGTVCLSVSDGFETVLF